MTVDFIKWCLEFAGYAAVIMAVISIIQIPSSIDNQTKVLKNILDKMK